MELISIYKCLCNVQRLRILNLLQEGPLCVCHLMEILQADQVQISKQLGFMRRLGLVEAQRQAQWMVYRLAEGCHPLLDENLKCLQDCKAEGTLFRQDLQKRRRLLKKQRASEVIKLLVCECSQHLDNL